MVANLIRWSSWSATSTGAATAKKFQVRLAEMKIDRFFADGDGTDKSMTVVVKWKGGPKTGLVPFHRPLTKRPKHVSGEAVVKKDESVKWGDEFENICNFPINSKDKVFGPFYVSFNFLYGTKTDAKSKMAVAGKVSVNLTEMATRTEGTFESEIPVAFNVAGVSREATFSVCMTFVEVRNLPESPGLVQNSTESTQVEDKVKKGKEKQKSMDGFCLTGSDSEATTRGSETCSVSGSETQQMDNNNNNVKKTRIFSWKRRRLSFKPIKTKCESLITRNDNGNGDGNIQITSGVDLQQNGNHPSIPVDSIASHPQQKPDSSSQQEGELEEADNVGQWEEKELKSRDGEATLKASVFFASFHQCSDKAAGESACTALVAVIAHWLLRSSLSTIPARSEFDHLIMQGSSEWRRLCNDENLINHFPDKHFDLETVMRCGVRPISVRHENSFIGFFGPDKFESLKGAMSFDQIWDEIQRSSDGYNRPRVYIVSWNDHFFVLKVDSDAYYIIDTLGERLYEGCNQAYVIRFDDSTLMLRGKVKRESEGGEEEICRGKECCREFIKRFLAAIPLGELEMQEKKEPVSYFDLHHRLQIEFNFTSLLSSSSSSSSSSSTSSPTNSTSSTFSSEGIDY